MNYSLETCNEASVGDRGGEWWAMGKSTYRRLLHSLFPDLRRIMAIIPTQKAGDFKFLEED